MKRCDPKFDQCCIVLSLGTLSSLVMFPVHSTYFFIPGWNLSMVGTMAQPFLYGCVVFVKDENPHPGFTPPQCLSNPQSARPLSKVISWIFLQREAIWPPCVLIKGRYGAVARSPTLSQGSSGLQQSAATLTGSLRLIGFDIEKWPPATFSENTHTDGLQECFLDRLSLFSLSVFFHVTILCLSLIPVLPLCYLRSLHKSVYLHLSSSIVA